MFGFPSWKSSDPKIFMDRNLPFRKFQPLKRLPKILRDLFRAKIRWKWAIIPFFKCPKILGEAGKPRSQIVFRTDIFRKLTLGAHENFLQHCFKCKYCYFQIDIYDVLEELDRWLFKISSMPCHPLYPSVPKTAKESSSRLRAPSSPLPRVNTPRFKNSFFYCDMDLKWILCAS